MTPMFTATMIARPGGLAPELALSIRNAAGGDALEQWDQGLNVSPLWEESASSNNGN